MGAEFTEAAAWSRASMSPRGAATVVVLLAFGPGVTAGAGADPAESAVQLERIDVTSTLGRVRSEIVPSIGATTYTIGGGQIDAIAQGENAPFSQILLRAPGVVQDSFGEDHVRGEHGSIQYRINGILLPEGLNGFGQELDTRFIDSVSLTTGTLPAQFGFRTAGVVDVVTKSGSQLAGGQLGVYGGSFEAIQPSAQFGNAVRNGEYYFSATGKRTGLGIENPTASREAQHDDSKQLRSFGYSSWQIDPSSRVSLLLSGSEADFQIPDTPGLLPKFALAGFGPPNSANLDERQTERDGYAVLAYQKAMGELEFQLAGFSRASRVHFLPDQSGDLIFNGVASDVREWALSNGIQFDAVRPLSDRHKLRAGVLMSLESATRDTITAVFDTDSTGAPLANLPVNIVDNGRLRGLLSGVYAQDEWHPLKRLTVNYGLRAEFFDAFGKESQLDPRLTLVWTPAAETTVHAGYARYFTPPTLQYISAARLAKFAHTTNAPETLADLPPRAERAHYFDAGFSRTLSRHWQVTLDGFYKLSSHTQDLGQFGNAVILAPFNYERGSARGGEASSNYHRGGFSVYANVSFVYTQAKNIETAQFEFPVAELAYVQNHYIRLDHEGEFTISSGVAYAWTNTKVFADFLHGSGLRNGFANESHLPGYNPVNLGFEHTLPLSVRGMAAVKWRVDLTNVCDETYRLRDGTGIGIAASQYGARRGCSTGVTVLF